LWYERQYYTNESTLCSGRVASSLKADEPAELQSIKTQRTPLIERLLGHQISFAFLMPCHVTAVRM